MVTMRTGFLVGTGSTSSHLHGSLDRCHAPNEDRLNLHSTACALNAAREPSSLANGAIFTDLQRPLALAVNALAELMITKMM